MTRIFGLFLAVLLFASVGSVCRAADASVVGTWDVVGTDDAGQTANWTLTVKDDGGKLGGTLQRRSGGVQSRRCESRWQFVYFQSSRERIDLHSGSHRRRQ